MPIIDTRGVFIGFTQKGNIFLCDYKSLDGIKANTINRKQQYLMAPLVLLHRTPDDKLMPIAIQVRRNVVRSDANKEICFCTRPT